MSAGGPSKASGGPGTRSLEPSPPVIFELARWPLVLVRWPAQISDQDLTRALEVFREIAARRDEHAMIYDARQARAPTAAQLGRIIDFARNTCPSTSCIANAVITRSVVIRALLDSIRWMHITPARYAYFDDLDRGVHWAGQQLARSRTRESGIKG